jgi:hypothetical protein
MVDALGASENALGLAMSAGDLYDKTHSYQRQAPANPVAAAISALVGLRFLIAYNAAQ